MGKSAADLCCMVHPVDWDHYYSFWKLKFVDDLASLVSQGRYLDFQGYQ